ncbi:MAG: tetratricopeptide repeat protein [Gammaproteobacteria bacterium]|nr:tetratricopeptide repeat protein [Gammaproteobacteria bacterium]
MRSFLLGLTLFFLLSCASQRPATLASLPSTQALPKPEKTVSVSAAPRQLAVASYRQLLAESKNPSARPEILRRLADLRLDEGSDADGDKRALREAAQLYQRILNQHSNFIRTDQVLYQLARAYDYLAQPDQVIITLQRLLADYPQSELFVESQFRLAQLWFSAGQYALAEKAYQAVLAQGDGGVFYRQALFMLGWSQFKQQKYSASRNHFMTLLQQQLGAAEFPQKQIKQLSRADQEQIDDLLRVMSLGFSAQGGVLVLTQFADAVLKKMPKGARYEALFYTRLALFYRKKERFSDAAASYQAFIDRRPLSVQAPLFHSRLIEIYQRSGFNRQVIQAKTDYIRRYGLDAPFWQQHQLEAWPEIQQALQEHLNDLARYYHARGQKQRRKTRQKRDYRHALGWYQTTLNFFPHSSSSATASFGKAEVLVVLGRDREAARAYEQSAYEYGLHPEALEAAYKTITTYQRLQRRAKKSQRAFWQTQVLINSERLVYCYPQHPQGVAVLLQAAEQRFQRGEWGQAWQLAQWLLWQKNLNQQQRQVIWTLLADVNFKQGYFSDAALAYEQALQHLHAKNRKQRRQRLEVQKRLTVAEHNLALEYRAEKQHQTAYELFSRAALHAPNKTLQAISVYDAATELLALQQWRKAAARLQAFQRNYPRHTLADEVSQKLAFVYLKSSQFDKAAATYETLARSKSSSEVVAREAAMQAAKLYLRSGKTAAAIEINKFYVYRFPAPIELKMEAQFRLSSLYKNVRNSKKRRYWLRQIEESYRSAPRRARSERMLFLLAQAQIKLAQPLLADYRRVRLREPLQTNLKKKKSAMQKAVKALDSIASLGVAQVTTQATYQLGDLYTDFSQALMNSQRPRGLDTEALEQYGILLEERAIPFEEQAIELHELNQGRIAKGIYDHWVQQSIKKLALLLPVRYNKQERMEAAYESAY